MKEIKDFESEKIAGGADIRSKLKEMIDELKRPISFENRKCKCHMCGEEFEERYPVNPPPGFAYMYWGKGMYCRNCWQKAHDEMGKKKN